MSSVAILKRRLNNECAILLATTTKVALEVEYDGTCYNGFQLQANAPSIQAELEESIFKLTGERLRVIAASRTDTGVHARGQIVSFRTQTELSLETFIKGLNHYLPDDISVRNAYEIDNDFDIRRRAISREYEYLIMNAATRSPLTRNVAWAVSGTLDISAMNQACQMLIGKHDFASFTTAEDIRIKNTVKLVYRAEVLETAGLIAFKIIADSFLHHQVRNTAGAMVKIGTGVLTINDFAAMIETRKPGVVGPKAPACGLCLKKVNYSVPLEDRWETTHENLSR